MSNSITVQVSTNSNGTINQEQTEATFRALLSDYTAGAETQNSVIEEHVNAIFDENLGDVIKMPSLVHAVCTRMNAVIQNYQAINDRVLAYVRSNSQGKKNEDGTVERPTSTLIVIKGAGGGVARRSDRSVVVISE